MKGAVIGEKAVRYIPVEALEVYVIAELKKHGRTVDVLRQLSRDVQFTLTCRLASPGSPPLSEAEFRQFWRTIFRINLVPVATQAKLFGIPENSMWSWLALLLRNEQEPVCLPEAAFTEVLHSALGLMREAVAEPAGDVT